VQRVRHDLEVAGGRRARLGQLDRLKASQRRAMLLLAQRRSGLAAAKGALRMESDTL
jgi:hypothetical protein